MDSLPLNQWYTMLDVERGGSDKGTRYSFLYEQLEAAESGGVPLHEYFSLPPHTKAIVVARYRAKRKLEYVSAELERTKKHV